MAFLSPIWLILLIPWAGLVVWLLLGRRHKTAVPFLNLWRAGVSEIPKPRRAWEKPPVALAALLAAILLAIFAAAGPAILSSSSTDSTRQNDVTIEMLSVRTQSDMQAMVRLLNQSDLPAVTLTAKAGGKTVQTQHVQLPGRGQTRNYFLDIPGAPSVVEVDLDSDEPVGIHHQAQASRRTAWPTIEAQSALSPELRRMIEVYTRDRPSGDGSRRIEIMNLPAGFDSASPAAFVVDTQSAGRGISAIEPLLVQDGPLTRSVDWALALSGASAAPIPPGNWQPVVSAAGVPVVATRSQPLRQVWIGFDSPDFAAGPDFVVFWSNIFEWLGDGVPTYDWVQPLKTPSNVPVVHSHSIAGILLVSAMGLIGFSAAAWRSAGRRIQVITAENALS